MLPRATSALMLGLALSACATSGSSGKVEAEAAPAYRAPIRAPAPRPARNAVLDRTPGLEGVIGASESALVSQFGPPRLNVWEGDARKLQFTGTACVLDIYLYPPSQGAPPQATWVEARRASDGKEVDKVACVRALKAPQ